MKTYVVNVYVSHNVFYFCNIMIFPTRKKNIYPTVQSGVQVSIENEQENEQKPMICLYSP